MRRWIVLAVVGVALGLALGLGIGWGLWPRESAPSPAKLRWDYQENYVIMVATAYEVEGDLGLAQERLASLDPQNPAAPVVQLGERLAAAGADSDDIVRLARLARDLGAITPPLEAYLEAQP
jgi:cytochrome c-type biogenesis protein CcmH/NrfG